MAEPGTGGESKIKGQGQPYYLPKAVITVTGQKPKDAAYQITVTKSMAPDRSGGRYYLAHSPNWMYEDGISIGVNTEGLLDGDQKADAKDKLPDTIVSIADSVVSAWKIGAAGGFSALAQMPFDERPKEAPKEFKPFQVSFSPGQSLAEVNKTLGEAGFEIVPQAGAPAFLGASYARSANRPECGIYYRVPTTYSFTIRSLTGYEGVFHRDQTVSVPSPSEVAMLPMKRVAFGELAQKGKFEAGQLTRVDINQNSPVLGVVSIPNRILGSVAGAVGNIFDNRSKARAEDKAAATAQLDQAVALAKLEKDLRDAQLATATSSSDQELKATLQLQKEILTLQQEIEKLKGGGNKDKTGTSATQGQNPDAAGPGGATDGAAPKIEAGPDAIAPDKDKKDKE